jgi:potassium-transporting ATPase ATP-binding subunit
LYAFTSAANNNGSAFAGIGVNTVWYNTALGLAMLLDRFLPIIFVLALAGSLAKQGKTLNPRTLWRKPVMFIVEIGAAWSTVLAITDPSWFAWLIVAWLWLTVIFANLAEAVAEGRGKAQAETLRRIKTATMARRLLGWAPGAPGVEEAVAAALLQQGDIVVVEAGQTIPGDGDVVEGIASVDESAITGESAPVIRESG